MFSIAYSTHEFHDKQEEVERVYQLAFAGKPWFENLSDEEVSRRTDDDIIKPGFQSFFAYNEASIVGAVWYHTPSIDDLRPVLAEFVRQNFQEIPSLVFEKEIFVAPAFQGKKIATRLREVFLYTLTQEYPQGVLVLSRMRDDNDGIIAVANKLGFLRTGIKMPSAMKPETNHEYWYRKINL